MKRVNSKCSRVQLRAWCERSVSTIITLEKCKHFVCFTNCVLPVLTIKQMPLCFPKLTHSEKTFIDVYNITEIAGEAKVQHLGKPFIGFAYARW